MQRTATLLGEGRGSKVGSHVQGLSEVSILEKSETEKIVGHVRDGGVCVCVCVRLCVCVC